MTEMDRIEKILKKLSSKKKTIALAESCTGGFVSHMITNISGSSNVFERGIVCESIENNGSVSETVARQLSYNIRVLSNVDIGIGITGIAGPTGGTEEKPVGLVYIGISTKEDTRVSKFQFTADRISFKKLVLEKVLEFLENNEI
jgi:PncC family amidohydrolase